MPSNEPASVSAALLSLIEGQIARHGGWLPFDRFMAMALYAPGLGYYSRGGRQFGMLPASGSDFVTAPELSPLFGQALARQVTQALDGCASGELWEFGAGSGALALQLLDALGERVSAYHIVDLSGTLRERQRATLERHAPKVRWLDALPERMQGVVVGNEVLDAMPVQLLHFDGREWHERGVTLEAGRLAWHDRLTALRPPHDGPFVPGTVTEIHPQAEAFVATLGERIERGAAFFIDYGFPAAEYYHPQRSRGTLMCHYRHRAHDDPFALPGLQDITAHVDFTSVADAALAADMHVLGYTSQAQFLVSCGITELLGATNAGDARAYAPLASQVQKLTSPSEMGELFKVIAIGRGIEGPLLGFVRGDRTHTL
jgi:SAM-dependent MidA family methyltransferase